MSPRLLTLPACVVLSITWACGDDPTSPDGAPFCGIQPEWAVPTFADPNLELAVRGELSLSPRVDLTCELLATVTDLTASNLGIVSLEGLENLTGLTTLWIRANEITDIGPLRGLTGLTSLNLADNSISDVTPLSGLVNLTFLAINQNRRISDIGALAGLTNLTGTIWLGENAITDLSPLGGATGLTAINAWDNAVTDISGLAGLTGLAELRVHINRITDVGAVSGLTSLTDLTLHNNPDLRDIQPLLANPALAAGANVNLRDTDVSCADVSALRAHGAVVVSDCPPASSSR